MEITVYEIIDENFVKIWREIFWAIGYSKERTQAYSSWKFKNPLRKKLLSEEESPSVAGFGVATIILINLNGRSLLRKKIYGNFKK